MKSVIDIQITLAKQWQHTQTRIERLLGDGLPIVLSIGRPKSADIRLNTHKVKAHQQQWQAFADTLADDDVYITWATHTYRATADAIPYPDTLTITTAKGWLSCLTLANKTVDKTASEPLDNKISSNNIRLCKNSRGELAHYLALLNRLVNYPSLRGLTQHSIDKCTRCDNLHHQSDNKNGIKTLSQTRFDAVLNAQLAILLRHPKRVMALDIDTLLQLLLVANLLTPACASGVPLRSLDMMRIIHASENTPASHTSQKTSHQQHWLAVLQSSPTLGNLDSKFFATHHMMLTWLLDTRYQSMVSEMGLEAFLQASASNQQWLMVYDGDYTQYNDNNHADDSDNSDCQQTHQQTHHQAWLPFATMQVRDSDLKPSTIPKSNILIIENEQCLHLLPRLPDTLVILGAGRNLAWLANPDWAKKNLWYWGDIDTWGLAILSDARRHQPSIRPVLMDIETLIQHQYAIVNEPTSYPSMPDHLTTAEQHLFAILRGQVDLNHQRITDTLTNTATVYIANEGLNQNHNDHNKHNDNDNHNNNKETCIQSKRLEQEFIKADWVASALQSLIAETFNHG